MLSRKLTAAALLALAALAAGVVLAGCGEHEEMTNSMGGVDDMFVTAMAGHHEAAVDMAKIARENGEHSQIRQLAADIITTQEEEIAQMSAISQRLESGQGAQHESMGMSDEEMGMSMDPSDLEDAQPFDRAFIDSMIPHHQGAIRMARMELDRGTDPETRQLAQSIIEAQAREIELMNTWRERWYGAPSPAGSSIDGGMHDDEGMGH